MNLNVFEEIFTAPNFVIFLGVFLIFSTSSLLIIRFCNDKKNPTVIAKYSGVVVTFITVPTSLFALTSALLGVSIWQNYQNQQDAVLAETRAMSAFIHLNETLPALRDKGLAQEVKAYAYSAVHTEWPLLISTRARSPETETKVNSLIAKTTALATQSDIHPLIGKKLIDSALDIYTARNVRLDMLHVKPDVFRWLCVFLLGLALQVTVAFVHIGNHRSLKVSAALTTISISFVLGLIAMSVNTFEGQASATTVPLMRILN